MEIDFYNICWTLVFVMCLILHSKLPKIKVYAVYTEISETNLEGHEQEGFRSC